MLHGRGFVLLRGWPSAEKSMAQNAMAFLGVGAHLGEAVSQNAKGHVLGHVTNQGLDYTDPTTRGYQTTANLRFHTDAGDMVGLLCMRPSKAGGLSSIASSTTVWNEIVRQRPAMARVLHQPFTFSRVGEVRPGQQRNFSSPIFQPCQGRMVAVLIQSFIEKAQAFEEVPKLTETQREALKCVNEMAEDPVTGWTWTSVRATCSFCPTTRSCIRAQPMRITPNWKDVATCCACGCLRRWSRTSAQHHD